MAMLGMVHVPLGPGACMHRAGVSPILVRSPSTACPFWRIKAQLLPLLCALPSTPAPVLLQAAAGALGMRLPGLAGGAIRALGSTVLHTCTRFLPLALLPLGQQLHLPGHGHRGVLDPAWDPHPLIPARPRGFLKMHRMISYRTRLLELCVD